MRCFLCDVFLSPREIHPHKTQMEQDGKEGPYKLYFNDYTDGGKVGKPNTLEVDIIVGADGANSRVAREIDAGEYDYAIAFQERIRIPEDKMEYYKVCWGGCYKGRT